MPPMMEPSSKPVSEVIGVLIADDHPVVREGLVTILRTQNDMKVLAEAADGKEVCDLCDQLFPDAIASKLAESMAHAELRERERQVLRYMASGRSNKEIGQILHISENTVKTHVKSILVKLGAVGRTEAISIATKRGLIQAG
jgi:DNA-binding NarL/FixJ family response regulator